MNGKPDTTTAALLYDFLQNRRDTLLCLAWIGSIVLVGGLLWFFTQSYRTRLLAETVNKTLARNAGREHVQMPPLFPGNPAVGGLWFKLDNSSSTGLPSGRAFVFTMIRNGNSAACVALTDSSGKVRTILPLGSNAEQILEELPLPVYDFYANRVEQDARRRMGGRSR